MITLECKKCNRKWKFYPKFLESKSFDDLYWDNYEKKEINIIFSVVNVLKKKLYLRFNTTKHRQRCKNKTY